MTTFNPFQKSSRLAGRMAIYVVLASTFITMFTSGFQLYEEYRAEVSSIESRFSEIRDSNIDIIASRVWVANIGEIEKTLQGILRLPDIEHITVYEDNMIIAEVGQETTSDTLEKEFPLTYEFRGVPKQIGKVKITASLEDVYQHLIGQAFNIIISNAIKTFLISGFILFLFYSLIARHLQKVASYAEGMTIGTLNQRLTLDRNVNDANHQDEFDVLINALHAMQSNLVSSISDLSESEQNLSQTLNCIGDAVIATDIKGCITRMNPVAELLTGQTFDDAQGKSLTDAFPIYNATTGKAASNPVETVLETGKTVGLANHTVLISKDGTEYQIADSAAPIKDENNKISGVILVFRNVTEEYVLQEAIRENEERLQALLNNSSSIIYVKDLDGKFTLVNRKFEQVFNFENEDIIGKATHDLFPEDVADEMVANDHDVLGSQLALHSDEKVLQEDGIHTYSSDKFCLFNSEGTPYAVGGISTDITEKLKQNELLRRSQKMDALGKLTGGVAHDFNNMLNVIIGYAEILRRGLDEDSSNAHFASEIKLAGERGAALTRKLLSFSGQISNEQSLVNINSILEDDINMLSKTMTARIHISMKLDNELWLTMVDKGELEDVILNLSINAMHAMPHSGKMTYFTLNERLDAIAAEEIGLPEPGDYVRLSIIDTGTGMPKETINQIFDPFFTTKGDQGTGLGLSQVYGFMERCKGAITVDSVVGKGTEFSLYFPRKIENSTANGTSQDDSDDSSELQSQGTETVLLVDDEAALLSLAQNFLKQAGYKVYCAEGADSALWILSRNKVDIMVSDVIMPGMSGVELAKKVETLYPEIKIQLVSGYAGSHDDADKNTPNLRTLLNKPYSADALLRRVREVLDSPR